MKKLIAIVAGGYSSEHDVSMRSAAGLLSFINQEQYECLIVDLERNAWNVVVGEERLPVCKDDFSFVAPDGTRRRFDFAYIIIHGTPGEDGLLQGYFDMLGIPYSTSGVLVESLTFDKFAINNYLRHFPDLFVSENVLVRRGEALPDANEVVKKLGLPCFVKPTNGGSSFGVTKVKTVDALLPAIECAMNEDSDVLIEALMTGTEVTCGAYKRCDEVVTFPITEVVTTQEFFDYDAKYNGKVDEITPARIDPRTAARVSAMTKAIYQHLDCYGIIRVDYILSGAAGQEELHFLEINTVPGMTATSFIPQQIRAAGLPIADVLADIIEGK